MRPIRLMMQAFGPYAEQQVLNMDDLGQTGIYAITGETGAGKTTIFDAIVYALYGSGSGEDRKDAKSLRSVAASPKLETWVELDFVSGGKRYSIVRKPAQRLAKKRGEGYTDQPASQALTMPDGKVFIREKEISERIEKHILGVTKDQFCQIVMIAQGEFRKLLRADTDERTVILRRIFRTERYNALSMKLEQLCKAKYAELSDCRRQVAFSLKSLVVDPASPLFNLHEDMKQVDPNALLLDNAVELANRIVDADAQARRAAGESVVKAEGEWDRARQAYEQAKRQAQKREELTRFRGTLKAQQAQLDAAARRREEAQRQKPQIEALGGEIATESRLLAKYGQLTELEGQRRRAEAQLKGAEADKKAAGERKSTLESRQAALTREAEGIRDAADRKLNASNALNQATARGKALDGLQARVKARDEASEALRRRQDEARGAKAAEAAADGKITALRAELEALGNTELALSTLKAERQALEDAAAENVALKKLYTSYLDDRGYYAQVCREYERKQEDARRLRAEAVALRERFNANIAGVWASKLLDDQPCPVCGSTHHPRKAVLSGEPVSEQDVKRAEEQANGAEKAYNEQAVLCSRVGEGCEGLRRQMAEKLPGVDEGAWEAEIGRRTRENAEARRQIDGRIAAAEQADKRLRQLRDTDIPAAQAALDGAKEVLKRAEQAAGKAEAELSAALREVADAAAGVMPEGWTALDLSDAIAENAGQTRRLQSDLNRAEKDIARLKEIEGLQARAAEELSGAIEAIHSAENRATGLSKELEGRDREIGALRSELPYPTEAACRASIADKTNRRQALEDAIRESEKAVGEWTASVAETTGGIKRLEEELKDAPEADLKGLEADFKAKEAALKAARDREKELHGRCDNNGRCRGNLLRQADAARKLEAEYRVMQEVSDTANGNVSGSSKLKLETYVQTAYFDRIINYANRRLNHISHRQYDLARQEVEDSGKQGKTGLKLDVVDHANGTRRAVGTLSGGESFLASLSFALGMSDAIQASATSAVQLDTMFVDEGFGSLSDSYLDLVMDELNETANTGRRLIGVISHVEDVKAGIDRRIEVTKSEGGVSSAVIC